MSPFRSAPRDRHRPAPRRAGAGRVAALLLAAALPAAALAPAPARASGLPRELPVGDPAETWVLYLSGTGSHDAVPWEFEVTGGRRAGEAARLPVPSNWELHGFGAYDYGHDEEKSSEEGRYRLRFRVPEAWRGRALFLHFEGVMTDAVVRLDGRPVGPAHRGAFYPFRYRVDGLLRPGGEHLLEVDVAKVSADSSVEAAERDADYWVFGGIFRPVWLEAMPAARLAEVAVDARGDGGLTVLARADGAPDGARVRVLVQELDGTLRAELPAVALEPAGEAVVAGAAPGVEPWSAETPRLYRLVVALEDAAGRPLHRRRETIGFRTVERRADGLHVNGRKVLLKGINRQSFWPDSGRATSPAVSRLDAGLIEELNANAVRTAHYPPDRHFLDECDRRGIYVIDELAGWHDAYSTRAGLPLARAMVERDRNRPSVILWANGNEDGWNRALDPIFRRLDPQRRPLIHPRDDFGGFATRHYPTRRELAGLLAPSGPRAWWRRLTGGSRLVMPTEMLHGLYDGGLGAGIGDLWPLLRRAPGGVGGFLWALFDEAVVRTDRGGALDTDGNHAPDGITGPRREREGSFAAVRRAWSPVAMVEGPRFAGGGAELTLENRWNRLDLASGRLRWELLAFPPPEADAAGHRIVADGEVAVAGAPGERVAVRLSLPAERERAHALALAYDDPEGAEVARWHWPLEGRAVEVQRRVERAGSAPARGEEGPDGAILAGGDTVLRFDRASGRLAAVEVGGRPFSLAGGPRLVGGEGGELAALSLGRHGDAAELRLRHSGALEAVRWRLFPSGWIHLRYGYRLLGERRFFGIGFDYPEGLVEGVRWLGPGPFRVWKNRPGGRLDVWAKAADDVVTGQSWGYPEFRGYHAPPRWLRLDTAEGRLTMVFPREVHLQLLRPSPWERPRHATAPFAAADLALLEAIPAIGSKFHPAVELGPSGRTPVATGPVTGEVWLRFSPRGLPSRGERRDSVPAVPVRALGVPEESPEGGP